MARGKRKPGGARGKRKPPSARKPQATLPQTPPPRPSPSPSPPPPQPSHRLPEKRVPLPPADCRRTWTLVVQWPPTRGFPIRLLTIHGAYPGYHFAMSEGVTCETFPKWLADLLWPVWPDLVFSNRGYYESIQFWVHEWRAHGMLSGLSIEDYFLTVLALYRCIPDLSVLGELGAPQTLNKLRQSFRKAIGAEIGVKGFYEGEPKHKVCYVLELLFEMDPHTEVPQFVDAHRLCLGHINGNVSHLVTFPSDAAPLAPEVMQKREAIRREARERQR